MTALKLGRNDLCACGSGKKYKKCCLLRDAASGIAPGAAPGSETSPSAASAPRLVSVPETPGDAPAPVTVQVDPIVIQPPGQDGGAETFVHGVLANALENPRTLHLLGLEALGRQDPGAALDCFRRALAMDGRDAACHYGMARAYEALGRTAEAVAFYLAAVSLRRDDREAADRLAALLARAGTRTVKLTVLHYIRIGELGLYPDLELRRRQLEGTAGDELHIFVSGESPANHQLLEMLKRSLTLIESDVLLAGLHQWIPNLSGVDKLIDTNYEEMRISELEVGGCRIVNEPPHRESNEYELYQASAPALSFTPEEHARGQEGLRRMGLDPERDWFVCLFARDPIYLNSLMPSYQFDDTRNADIDGYIPAAAHIAKAGGWVIRMGHGVAKPFALEHPRVVDYATRCRDDFMDIYLMAHCRFALGTTSGICDMAMLFDRPRIGTNWLPLGSAPWGKHCLFVPKLLRDRETGEPLAFGRFLEDTRDFSSPLLWSAENSARYVVEDNTPEDILAATFEMMERLDGSFRETAEDRALQERYFARFPAGHWSAEVRTPMGRDFLRQHQAYFLES